VAEQLSKDMKKLLEVLNRWRAQYLVIGAHALGVYTEPRGTKDLDIWVNPAPENAKLVVSALKEYGAPLFDTTEQFFSEPETFLTVGVAPNRIDVRKSVPGVEFDACWKTKRTLDVGGAKANFPSPQHLLAAKLAAGRPQDLIDAAKLREAIELELRQPAKQPRNAKKSRASAQAPQPKQRRKGKKKRR
jgi:hypothetical protein